MNEFLKLRNKTVKRINKIFRKLFGVENYKLAVDLKNDLKKYFEKLYNKNVSEIQISDLNRSDYYNFAKLRTLQKIINLYSDIVSLSFYGDELEEYNEHQWSWKN